MDNSFGVGGVESVGNFDGALKQLLQFEGASLNRVPQSLAFQILHYQEDAALVLADFVDGADVRMIQSGGRTSFAPKAFQGLWISGQGFGQKFKSDKTAELKILGLINHAHPATPDFLHDAVMRDGLPNQGLWFRHCRHILAERARNGSSNSPLCHYSFFMASINW